MKKIALFLLVMVSLTTKAQVPNEPANLVIAPINTGGMIQFTPPSSIGGSAITNYEYSTDGGANWNTPSPAITTSPLIISSGLTNCTSYQVKIRAVNTAGSGTASSTVELIPTTSVLGVNWTARSSAANNNWLSVTYGNGIFVAVCDEKSSAFQQGFLDAGGNVISIQRSRWKYLLNHCLTICFDPYHFCCFG